MVCKGICVRHKACLPVGESRYINGRKRCQTCSIFMIWSTDTCPCCGIRLRTKARIYRSNIRAESSTLKRFSHPIMIFMQALVGKYPSMNQSHLS